MVPDILHDVLEGVLPLELKLMLKVKKKKKLMIVKCNYSHIEFC